jgi:hypothetical protein
MSNIPMLVDPVFDIIREVPGCTTPFVCLTLGVEDGVIHRDINAYLGRLPDADVAAYLAFYHKAQWESVCQAIDWCLDEGTISFSDDGELRATG